RPALAARSTSVSRLNFAILPCSRSFKRGCVIPRRWAAAACVTFQLRTRCSTAISRLERMVMLAASSAESVSASHTLSKLRRFIVTSPKFASTAMQPDPDPALPFAASSFETHARHKVPKRYGRRRGHETLHPDHVCVFPERQALPSSSASSRSAQVPVGPCATEHPLLSVRLRETPAAVPASLLETPIASLLSALYQNLYKSQDRSISSVLRLHRPMRVRRPRRLRRPGLRVSRTARGS